MPAFNLGTAGAVIYGPVASPGFQVARTYVRGVVTYAPPLAFFVLLPVAVGRSFRRGGFFNGLARQIGEANERAFLEAHGGGIGEAGGELPAVEGPRVEIALPPMWARDP